MRTYILIITFLLIGYSTSAQNEYRVAIYELVVANSKGDTIYELNNPIEYNNSLRNIRFKLPLHPTVNVEFRYKLKLKKRYRGNGNTKEVRIPYIVKTYFRYKGAIPDSPDEIEEDVFSFIEGEHGMVNLIFLSHEVQDYEIGIIDKVYARFAVVFEIIKWKGYKFNEINMIPGSKIHSIHSVKN